MPAKAALKSSRSNAKGSTTAGESTPKSSAGKATAKRKTDQVQYTKPELRLKLKDQIQAGTKGGRASQWSARKAQLLVAEYEKQGGGYKQGKRTDSQKHLQTWTEEKWQTIDGKNAQQGKATARYLPKAAWEKLTPAQRQATNQKKKAASQEGQQFVANTAAAAKARKSVVRDE